MTKASPPEARAALARLFRAAGAAHHQAFAATNGDDPEWPAWYAGYLATPMRELLGDAPALDALAGQLRALDAEYRARTPQLPWPEYYAQWFLSRANA